MKISSGAKLLDETRQTIAEVTALAGFADQSYFDEQFKRTFGCTLNEFASGADLRDRTLAGVKII